MKRFKIEPKGFAHCVSEDLNIEYETKEAPPEMEGPQTESEPPPPPIAIQPNRAHK